MPTRLFHRVCFCRFSRLAPKQSWVPHLRVVLFDAKVGINQARLRLAALALCLLGSVTAAAAPRLREEQALWLSQQLHRPIEASQILLASEATTLEGCTITRARLAATGATALSLRCPSSRLPHLVLLNLSSADAPPLPASFNANPSTNESPVAHIRRVPATGAPISYPAAKPQLANVEFTSASGAPVAATPNIVRAGAALRADLRTGFIHAQLPVIALDPGTAGAEIRVRILQTNHIVRARILSADAVAILVAGA
jgi:hypothetical protein